MKNPKIKLSVSALLCTAIFVCVLSGCNKGASDDIQADTGYIVNSSDDTAEISEETAELMTTAISHKITETERTTEITTTSPPETTTAAATTVTTTVTEPPATTITTTAATTVTTTATTTVTTVTTTAATTVTTAATTAATTAPVVIIGAYDQREQEQWEIDYAEEVFALVNQIRAEYGLDPYQELSSLTDAAVTRAWEISVVYSHTRPDGAKCSSVVTENGLNFSYTGENIAAGQASPSEVVSAWMSSTKGHREAILSTDYKYMGVGFYYVPDGNDGYKYYWAQEFYTPL